jgi:hypothetical protein
MQFPVINAHRAHRLPWISKLLVRPPFPLKQVKSALTHRFPVQVKRVGKLISSINTRPVARPEIAVELRSEMAREFAGDIELLGTLIGRNLGHWYKGEQ